MPRDFVPQFYTEKHGQERVVVGAEASEDGSKVYVQFSGGEYGVFEISRISLALGLPTDPVALGRGILRTPYAVLRALPGTFKDTGSR